MSGSRPSRERSGGFGVEGDPADDLRILTRSAVREVDRRAVAEFGMPSIVLMENAALHLCDVVLDVLDEQEIEDPHVAIVCGRGNNGGDGLALARHLSNAGVGVSVWLIAAPGAYAGDAGVQMGVVTRMGIPCEVLREGSGASDMAARIAGREKPDLVVDALLGTGLEGRVQPHYAAAIGAVRALRESGCVVVSVDLPSGLDADTGEPLGEAVVADLTVTFVGLKRGFDRLTAQEHLGTVIVADIGVPRALVESLGEPVPPGLLADDEDDDEGDDAPEAERGEKPGGWRRARDE